MKKSAASLASFPWATFGGGQPQSAAFMASGVTAVLPGLGRWALSVSLVGFLLAGCPGLPDAPVPERAASCETLAECNAGAVCGHLRACVGGFCEESCSVEAPCDPQRRCAEVADCDEAPLAPPCTLTDQDDAGDSGSRPGSDG